MWGLPSKQRRIQNCLDQIFLEYAAMQEADGVKEGKKGKMAKSNWGQCWVMLGAAMLSWRTRASTWTLGLSY